MLQSKPLRDPGRQMPQNHVIDLADDLLHWPGGIDDVSIADSPYKRQVSLSLPGRFFKGDLLFACLQHVRWGIQKDDQVRLGDKSPNQPQQPGWASITIAPWVHESVDQMTV